MREVSMAENVRLGQEVKDPVTGYKGTVVGITEFLYGCRRVAVQAKVKENGEIPDLEHFDEPQVVITKKTSILDQKPVKKEPPGGPMPFVPKKNKSGERRKDVLK